MPFSFHELIADPLRYEESTGCWYGAENLGWTRTVQKRVYESLFYPEPKGMAESWRQVMVGKFLGRSGTGSSIPCKIGEPLRHTLLPPFSLSPPKGQLLPIEANSASLTTNASSICRTRLRVYCWNLTRNTKRRY